MAEFFTLEAEQIQAFLAKLAVNGLTAEMAKRVVEDQNLAARMVDVASIAIPITWKVTVDFKKSLKEMFDAGHFDAINDRITEEHFPSQGSDILEVELECVHLDRQVTTQEVLIVMGKRNLRPATFAELLAFEAANHEQKLKYSIVALGTFWHHLRKKHYVYSRSANLERNLCLTRERVAGWTSTWRFLAAH